MPASWTPVMPAARMASCAARMCRLRSSGRGERNHAIDQLHGTVDEDARRLPVLSRGGSGRRPGPRSSSSMRARRKASELAQPAWPSTRLSQTGRSGRDGIEHGRGGKEPPGQRLWSQLPPVIQASRRGVAILAFTRRATSSSESTPRRSTCSRLAPSDSMCPWASIRPGMAKSAGRSTTGRSRPAIPHRGLAGRPPRR